MHRLHRLLVAAAGGRFPDADGCVELLAPLFPSDRGVFEFTGHSVVLTDRDPEAFAALGADGFGGATHPDVLRWLAGPGGAIGAHDAVLVASGTRTGSEDDGVVSGGLEPRDDLDEHPRVRRSRRYRRDVVVHGDDRGFVTLGHGVVDRLEIAVELFDESRGARRARGLIEGGLALVPAGDLVWAQVAPGNAASLRAFLACGFVPIGAERLVGIADD